MGDHPFLDEYGPNGSSDNYLKIAQELESKGERRLAASAVDRAYGLDPSRADIAEFRRNLLDSLAIEEDGIQFRYIPAGTFLMGSDSGDPDERPIHPVKTGDYWLSETPVSWATFARIMGQGLPPEIPFTRDLFELLRKKNEPLAFFAAKGRKMWNRYCSSAQPPQFATKPLVAVCFDLAEEVCGRLSTSASVIRLPKESEWEKGARGGLIGVRYAWGDNPPSRKNCDFDRFSEFSIKPFHTFPPNGYGLYAMCGGVWEWTSDAYDANSYTGAQADHSALKEQIVRGGSWADCAEAMTVSFRMSLHRFCVSPNVGFRLCRIEHGTISESPR